MLTLDPPALVFSLSVWLQGLAKALQTPSDTSNARVGSASWMAPEVINTTEDYSVKVWGTEEGGRRAAVYSCVTCVWMFSHCVCRKLLRERASPFALA